MQGVISFPPPDTYSLNELQRRLSILKSNCPLQILGADKNRSSAVGESLEKYLGLYKNSKPIPDWGEYELKTSSSSNSKLSMFTMQWDFLSNYSLENVAAKYGKRHISRHLQLPVLRLDHSIPYIIDDKPMLHFKISEDTNKILLKYSNEQIAEYSIKKLEKKFIDKFSNFVLINIKKERIEDINSFSIITAVVFKNPSFHKFIESIKQNKISLDLQIFITNPDTINEIVKKRASKFRSKLSEIQTIYSNREELSL